MLAPEDLVALLSRGSDKAVKRKNAYLAVEFQFKQHIVIMRKHYFLPRFCFFAILFTLAFMQGKAQVSLTPSNLVYTQNFDSFEGNAASVATHLPGWTVSGNTDRNQNCGDNSAGGLYAFGDSGDYSLGFLPAAAPPNNQFTARVTFENNTGAEITEVTISYNFERWRPAARINGFAVTSDLGDVSALNQTGVGNTGSNCVVLTTAKTVTLTELTVADGATFYVEFFGDRGASTGSSQGVSIDDFRLEATLAATPQLSAGALTSFGVICINTTSTERSFAVNGTNLTNDDVTVVAPTGYGISTQSGGPYTSSLLFSPVLGEVSEAVYIVFQPVAPQLYSGNVVISGGGADPINVAVSGGGLTSNPSVSITSDAGANVCAGETVTFTATPTSGGSDPVYQWKVNGSDVGTNSATYTTNSLLNGDEVTCEMISNEQCADGTPVVSNAIEINIVTEITPTITISSDAGTVTCEGTEVTFTATITDGGSNPMYQWRVSGIDAGTNSATFTTTTLNNGDVVTCLLTSNAACTNGTPVLSNGFIAAITALPSPSISIISDVSSAVCEETEITFTATITDGGSNPTYQWKVNGANAGTNSPTFSSSTLADGDEVTCELLSDAACASTTPVASNSVEVELLPIPTPTISISADATAVVCEGTEVTFTATITDGGSNPTYQWKLNGSNVGTNSNTYSSSTLNDGDEVTCELVSDATCASTTPVASNTIEVEVSPILVPTISISADATGSVCEGTEVTFTATITNGGSNPTYQWKLNGSNAGTNSNTYSSSTLNDGDEVTCELVSDAACASTTPIASNTIEVEVSPILVPTINISADATGSVCEGTEVTFTATITNGGSNPTYQWKVNGANEGTNSSTFSSSTLADGDVVTCELTSDAFCSASVTSNDITADITSAVIPSVSITATPGVSISSGETVTFTASPTNGGTSPTYQWLLNGNNVGTNSATYVSSTLNDGDEVSCILYSDAVCALPDSAVSNTLEMQVSTDVSQFNRKMTTLSVYPNPSEGVFRLKGQLVSTQTDLKIEVLNAIGQVVYTETVSAGNGELNRQLSLTGVQNGLYFVRVQQGEAVQVLRITINR